MNPLKKILSSGLIWLWISVVVIVIDRLTKMWVVNHLTFSEPLQLTSFFNLTLVYNTGAAFSFLHSASGWQNIFLCSVALVVSVMIVVWLAKLSARAYWVNIALALILGGALGNVIDRMLFGYVIDFFDFHLGEWHFAIFNTADSAICVGAFLLICHWIWQKK